MLGVVFMIKAIDVAEYFLSKDPYSILWSRNRVAKLPPEIEEFLDKIYKILENAPLDELIEISHEDSEWKFKRGGYQKEKQRMNSLARALEYQSQFEIMEYMSV